MEWVVCMYVADDIGFTLFYVLVGESFKAANYGVTRLGYQISKLRRPEVGCSGLVESSTQLFAGWLVLSDRLKSQVSVVPAH